MLLSERFWSKVDIRGSDDCWEWKSGKRKGKGYGAFLFNGKNELAHRIAWILAFDGVPEGIYVLHRCDNPGCVNPKHLFLGTHQDNMEDMVAKNRQASGDRQGLSADPTKAARGERHGRATITEDQAKAIKSYGWQGCRASNISIFMDIDQQVVSKILRGRTWKHIPEPFYAAH